MLCCKEPRAHARCTNALQVNGLSLLTTVTLDGAEGSMISILDNQSGRNALLELTASQAAALPPGCTCAHGIAALRWPGLLPHVTVSAWLLVCAVVEAGDDAATDAWQALRKQLRVTENDEGRLQLDFA